MTDDTDRTPEELLRDDPPDDDFREAQTDLLRRLEEQGVIDAQDRS